MNNKVDDNNSSNDIVEGSIFMLLLLSTLLTQIQMPYFKYGIHNVLIPVFALVLIWLRSDVLKEFYKYHRKTLVYMALLYLWLWISAFFSDYTATAIKYCVKYSFYPIMLASFMVLTYKNKSPNAYYRLIIYFLILLGLFGILEMYSQELGIFKVIRPFGYTYYRVSSLMQNPNPFGVLMSVGILLAILLNNAGVIGRYESTVSIVIFALNVFFSGSRNAILILLIGLVSLGFYQYGKFKVFMRWAVISTIGIIIAFYFYQVIIKRLSVLDNLVYRYEHAEYSTRLLLMKRSLYELMRHPFSGIGIEVFSSHIGPQVILGSSGLHTHNIILNVLVELGFIGLILTIFFCYSLFRGINWRNPLIAIPVIMIFASQMFDYLFHDYTFPAFAFILIAIAANSKDDIKQEPHLAV